MPTEDATRSLNLDMASEHHPLVRTAVAALEVYDPFRAICSQRRAFLTARLAEATAAATRGPYGAWGASPEQREAIWCASILADIGVFGVSRDLFRKDSISAEERSQIQSHVEHGFRILSTVPWRGAFARIPGIVRAHHEMLNGSGYPRALRAAEIPPESRMIAIADQFAVLVSRIDSDGHPVSVERVLAVLREEAHQGKLDRDLVDLFVDARVWERTPTTPMPPVVH